MSKFRYPLHIHLSTLFIIMTVVVSGSIAAIGYRMSYDMLASSAEELTHRASREVLGGIKAVTAPVHAAVDIFAFGPLAHATTLKERMARIQAMSMAVTETTGISGFYVGYESGDFFMLQPIVDERQREFFKAPDGAQFIVRSIERNIGKAVLIYLDEHLVPLSEELKPSYLRDYDPRRRDWYIQAQQNADVVVTQPYIFHSLRKIGVSVARRAGNGKAIVAADIPLDTLSDILAHQKVTPSTQLAIVRADGKVIANENLSSLLTTPRSSDEKPELKHIDVFGIAPMQGLAQGIAAAQKSGEWSRSVDLSDGRWQLTVQPLSFKGAEPYYLLSAIPEKELFAVALKIRSTSILGALLILLIAIPAIWLTARTISKSMRQLAGEAEAIRHFDFDSPVQVDSIISEVHHLADTMELMKRAIRKFMSITHSVAAEENFEDLLYMLLRETMNVGKASAGALYLVENDTLVPCLAHTGDGSEISGSLLSIPLSSAPLLVREAVAQQGSLSGKISQEDMEPFGLDVLTAGSKVPYTVVVPLLNRQRHLLGLMLLQRDTQITGAQLAFAGAISDSASSSLETRGLIRDQKALFESFIQLMAGAIDAKSAYTGGHCARVPELTKMLVHAACDTKSGPYADFDLTEDEWEAVHVAGWLHDCGKVTTPEYVVDKATKLETIYDRIHEVRMRFEVLKRDAEIDCLKAIAAGTPEAEARAHMTATQKQLDEDFAFVAECNLGGEFMAPEKVDRLKGIASRTWLRTLDDALGISHEEAARRKDSPVPPLPVAEPLLADRPEHKIERRESEKLPPGNKWGFTMKVPELLYNRGEMHNLVVSRGTLSEEERYKINEHIVQTIIMLSALPFPEHLKNVPELAGGHHEKMDGTGYPKGLKKEEMSPVARMMAIADIFEALTARDRPYKKGKTLSESIRIMGFMKKDHHIDPELFELFLRSGVYREYANRYMTPEQIDEVDIEAALAT